MRIVRAFTTIVASAGVLAFVAAAPAGASVGPTAYQALATAQSQQVMRNLTSAFDQVSSPVSCDRAGTASGTLLLPVLAGRAGNRTFDCVTHAHTVLVDLGGFICTEDNDPDDVYTTADGTQLRFSHGNLEAICQDAIRFVTIAPLVVDGRTVTRRHVAVGTPEFTSTVHRSTGAYWDSSVALGHPGTLWSAYGGVKHLLALDPGRHTVVTDLSAIIGAPAVLTFRIDVCA